MPPKPQTSGAPARKSPPKGEAAPTSFGPVRILVADDEHLIATSVANSAADLGHTIVGIAADGEIAVGLAREHKPDLALLDIRMPKLGGIDAAMLLYGELRIPSVIISAYSDEENIKKIHSHGEAAGVFGFVIKPVIREQLSVAIAVALQRAAVSSRQDGRITQLQTNLQHRRMVEQAKWVLVEKRKITEPQAHELLQKAARDRRKPLAEIAKVVVETGEMPRD